MRLGRGWSRVHPISTLSGPATYRTLVPYMCAVAGVVAAREVGRKRELR
jgi:hypothetical protein